MSLPADAPRAPALDAAAIQSITAECAASGVATALPRHAAALAASSPSVVDAAARRWLAADPSTAALLSADDGGDDARAAAPRAVEGEGVQKLRLPDAPVREVVERGGAAVKVFRREKFVNWGRTVRAVPEFTFVPRTKEGVQAVVRFARKEGMVVRCGGARHSWTPIFGADGGVFVSFLEIGEAVPLTDLGVPEKNEVDRELERIEVVSDGRDGRKARVRVGAAVTGEHWRAWSLSADGGRWRWMLPALPIIVEVTLAGSAQPMCHGAGRRHPSVADFVVAVEIVNVKGEIQVVEGDALRAAAGAMGLAGVVVSQTLELDPLRIARLQPKKVPVMLSVPPVDEGDLPDTDVDFRTTGFGEGELARAEEQFRKNCDAFYSEWFFFPFQDETYENIWDVEDEAPHDPTTPPPEFLSDFEVKVQGLQTALASILESTVLRLLPGPVQAKLFGAITLAVLPDEPLRISVNDALHFQRGIHNIRVRDMELELEIPTRADGSPDFSIVQRAWWAGIRAIYAARDRGTAPVRTALEMRIIGPSEMLLSSQRGAKSGMCSIEVLTNSVTPEAEWREFIQEIADAWASIVDPVTKKPLRALPHWAKEWPGTMRGVPTEDYLKREFESAAGEFKEELGKIASEGGYERQEMFRMFGNRTLLDIIGEGDTELLGTGKAQGSKSRFSWLNCFSA